MAINYGYIGTMNVSIAEAKNRLPKIIRAVELGEEVVITRHGRPVAQIVPAPQRREVKLGGMKDVIQLPPGWDTAIDEDAFLAGGL
jgi:prevent-host-death family protein